jgi:hypothetical protein
MEVHQPQTFRALVLEALDQVLQVPGDSQHNQTLEDHLYQHRLLYILKQ